MTTSSKFRFDFELNVVVTLRVHELDLEVLVAETAIRVLLATFNQLNTGM